MYEVSVALSAPEGAPDDVFRTISDYDRYPERTDAVIAVRTDDLGGGRRRSSWEVAFRRGILRWTEEGVVDPGQRRIDFALVDGDLDHLTGHWQVDPAPRGSTIRFWCAFDIGIPTLAHLIEPVAAQTLRDNVLGMCAGLFGTVEPLAGSTP